jgi:hypothetical protein
MALTTEEFDYKTYKYALRTSQKRHYSPLNVATEIIAVTLEIT